MNWTESDIQGLKAQEAKDLAIEFLHKLEAKERGPISPGEVQLKELDFAARLREAEVEDNRRRDAHELQIKQLELQIESEKTRYAQQQSQADEVRQSYSQVIDRVAEASESLSTRLERAEREHNLKVEQLESTFAAREAELTQKLDELEERRGALREEISALTELQGEALQVGRLREEIARRKRESQREHAQMEEQIAAAEFEKTKAINNAKRTQEIELATLAAQHEMDVLQRNRQAADAILEALEMVAVEKQQWERVQQQVQDKCDKSEEDLTELREQTREEMRRQYNITRPEAIDVTDLFYREQAARAEGERLRGQLEKLETEVSRMRQHIEMEPQRIAKAVEAAKTQVQNYIEQGAKR